MQGTIENYCNGWTWNTCVLFFSLFKLCLFALNWRSVRFQNPSCIVRQRMTESFPFPGQRERTQLTPVHNSSCLFERSRLFCCMFRCPCAQRWFERPGYFPSHADIQKHCQFPDPFQKVHKTKCHPYHQPPPWGQRRWWLWQKTTNSSATAARHVIRWTGICHCNCLCCKARHQMNR